MPGIHGNKAGRRRADTLLVAVLTVFMLSGCVDVGGGGVAGSSLVAESAPQRVVMRIVNNSCGESEDTSDSLTTGSVKGLSKVLNGFGVPYDERADNYTTSPTVVTDDSEEANKERGIGYTGIEDHYVGALAPGEEHSPDHPEHEDVGCAMFPNLSTKEEQYGCAMRWEYYNPDLSGPAVDGYFDFLTGNGSGHMQYLAVHATVSDKWVIVCPYDWGPALNLPTTGGGKYAGGRIGGLSPAAAEALGIAGGDGPENAMTEWWWVENSSQVECGPIEDLSALAGGSGAAKGGSSSSSSPSAKTTTAIITAVTGASSDGSISIAPANPSSFINMERTEWQHGDLPKGKVKYIMMHDTESGTDDPANIATSWSGNHVAAHFVVGKDGTIIQCVPINKIAHHAGECGKPEGANDEYGITQERDDLVGSVTDTDYAMNAWSIGIEIVHEHNEGDYPNAQLNAVDRLVAYIDQEVGGRPKIIDHKTWSAYKQDCSDNFPLANYQKSRNHNGVTTEAEAVQAAQNGGCSDVLKEEESEEFTGTIADAAVSLAGSASPEASIPGGAMERPTDSRLSNYVTNHDSFFPSDSYYASCDRSSATAIRLSGADPEFPPGPSDDQLAYCQGSNIWKEVGKWRLGDSSDMLQPGDVLVTDGHIKIFVGNEAVRKKFPNSDANMYAGSYGQHNPWCYDESTSYDAREYSIFRCVGAGGGDAGAEGTVDDASDGEGSEFRVNASTAESSVTSSKKGRIGGTSKKSSGTSKSMVGNTASGSLLGKQCAWLAVQMAATGNKGDGMMNHLRLPDGALHQHRISDGRLNNCYAIHEATLQSHRGNMAIASCTQTATAVAAAVVDMDMCPCDDLGASGGPDAFIRYCTTHPDIFQEVSVGSIDELQPGDFLANSGHTALFVGTEMAQTKFPGTDCNVYEAGYYSRAYGGLSAYRSADGYRIFRPVKRNMHAEFDDVDWPRLVTDWSCDPPTGSGSSADEDSGPAVNVGITRV